MHDMILDLYNISNILNEQTPKSNQVSAEINSLILTAVNQSKVITKKCCSQQQLT